jgi:UDPglucose 6-dehydrogenase
MNKNVLVFGAGYVGFSLSVVMARVVNVTVLDIRDEVIDDINKGKSPIDDQGIDRHLSTALDTKRLKSEKYSVSLVEKADFIVLALPTNLIESDGSFDTSALDDVIEKISKIDRRKPIIIKSTIPVGYTERVIKKYKLTECMYSPEFLREGRATHDNLHPSRIIVGSSSPLAKEFAQILDDASHQRDTKKIFTDNTTAEVTKLSANTYLAARVAFFNELDTLALEAGLNPEQLIAGICSDSRIGEGYNNPSFGYGGYCLPKDVKQFQSSMLNYGVKSPLIQSINLSNQQRIDDIVSFVEKSGVKNIGIYRAQMKQGSDNARESVSLALLEKLASKPNLEVKLYEPKIKLSEQVRQLTITDLATFGEWSELILANRDAVELQPYKRKVMTRDIYNEN